MMVHKTKISIQHKEFKKAYIPVNLNPLLHFALVEITKISNANECA